MVTDRPTTELAAAIGSDADTDTVLDALADADRRFVVAWLDEASGSTTLDELARPLAAWKLDEPDETPPDSAVETAQIELYHCHVPKLADAALVEYDRGRGEVSLAVGSETLRESVELPERTELPSTDV